MFVSGNVHHRVALVQGLAQAHQGAVLRGFKPKPFQAFELNAHRGVVTAFAAAPMRSSGVPSPSIGIDKLHDLTVAANEEVAGDFGTPDLLKVRMSIPIQAVGEEFFNVWRAVHPRRQADGVDHQQVNRGVCGPGPKVG